MHPRPDKRHVMAQYRRHILASKKKWGSARSLIHYKRRLVDQQVVNGKLVGGRSVDGLIEHYLIAKREVIKSCQHPQT